ncbi:MAG: aspartate/tyrosine/aromatic aminotransferase [Candidatus Hydrogenedentes bacterium]|nr:aspartate/tyrosine/aromatic aminotransferase [Candidatus Hydrogenedentota bacterium]
MFTDLTMAPADPILGLTESFKKDANPSKINLGVGVYKDEEGRTPIFQTVKKAEEMLLQKETSKDYLGISGAAEYGAGVQELVFGKSHEIIASHRAATAHTPGGTAALRVAADFIKRMLPGARIWTSDPTWANHPNVFKAAGLEVLTYPYYDEAAQGLAFDKMLAALRVIPKTDVVMFHACCHNPCGIDPTHDQWKQIAEVSAQSGFLVLFDFAYQGLGDGLEADAAGLRLFCVPGCELLICSSFSKNFGLYNERVGALTVVGATEDAAAKAFSHIKSTIRANYSNPPAHGAAIVSTILGDPALRAEWNAEVTAMRDRINGMRKLFVDTLKAKGVARDFSFLTRQKGMFSFSGLTKAQVESLRAKYALYIVGSGRINVAGMTRNNMDALCTAIADVLK